MSSLLAKAQVSHSIEYSSGTGNYFEIARAEPGNPIVAAARRVAGS
jgi:hypothetical protein